MALTTPAGPLAAFIRSWRAFFVWGSVSARNLSVLCGLKFARD
jgi:hypothetical protein